MTEPDDPLHEIKSELATLTADMARLRDLTTRIISLLLEGPEDPATRASAESFNLAAGFTTRDHVQLVGCTLRVNNREIALSKRQAILVAILIRHALAGECEFLSTRSIIGEIEEEFGAEWPMPMPEDIHEVVYRIRRKLDLARELLETAPTKGGGIRLSTPCGNIAPLKSPWIRKSPSDPTG